MFDSVEKKIVKKLNESEEGNYIVIFRGFPNSVLSQISIELESTFWPYKEKFISNDMLFEIDKLVSAEFRQSLKKSVFGDSRFLLLSAEEGMLLDEGDYKYSGRKIISLSNDLIDEYPNQTTATKLLETEESINTFIKDGTPDGWCELYAESVRIGDKIYVRPQSPNLPNNIEEIKISSLVLAADFSSYLFSETEIRPTESLSNTEEFDSFILDVMFDSTPHDRYVSVSQAILDDQKLGASWKLGVLSEASGLSGFELRYVVFGDNFDEIVSESKIRSDLTQMVNKYWGGDFRKINFYKMPEYSTESISISQGTIAERIISNTEDALDDIGYSDVFITAPTGAGKSLLFQLPAIYLKEKYDALTIVISPLKALMSDQVNQLKAKGIDYVDFLNSDKSHLERDEILSRVHSGQISILYLSPELLLSYDISYFTGDERRLALMIIDEAHLITTWGRDFRVDYWYLGTYLKKLRNKMSFPVVCLTATAVYGGDDDTVFDTIETLDLKSPEKFIGIARRTNINFDIKSFTKINQYADEKIKLIEDRIRQHALRGEKTLVYCPYKSQIDSLYSALTKDPEIKNKIGRYYSGLDKYAKQEDENAFKTGVKPILIATKAFGMGVDISDIIYVYHYAPNGTVADYVQEIGRAARDQSLTGMAQTDYGEKDLNYAKTLFGLSSIKKYQLDLVMKKLLERYDQKKKQNMLFSVADFSYIFATDASRDTGGDDGALNQKVLSTLMLIEKDFLRRYRYNVVIARPKALFTEVFACVDRQFDEEFILKFGNYTTPAIDQSSNTRLLRDRMGSAYNARDMGNIYKIDLAKLWEEKFSDESFPSIKYKFYSKELFGGELQSHVFPRYNLAVNLKSSVSDSKLEFERKLQDIAQALNDPQFSGRFFTQKELAKAFRDKKITRDGDSLAALMCNLYSSQEALGYSHTAVLQERKVSGIPKYQVISRTIYRLHSEMLRAFNEMFYESSRYSRFLNVEKTSLARNPQVRCAYFLEALGLASYEFIGGNNPQTFVRVNDVRHLRNAVNDDNYKNVLWKNVKERHIRSMKLLNYFFAGKMGDTERWDFIEKYFLGQVDATSLQLIPDASERNEIDN